MARAWRRTIVPIECKKIRTASHGMRLPSKNFKLGLSSFLVLCLKSKCSIAILALHHVVLSGSFPMLHFSCDLCGQSLGERRYVVKMEIFPAFDPQAITEDDLDSDHLEEVAELITEMEATGSTHIDAEGTRTYRFDLCPRCQAKYSKDPLGRDALRRLDFSKN
jgi:hypothetical protein